ncbi:hypothetical protein [Clostridium estertheticum]|uniref:hypothetical protein n=1 Tax=Clostridium estertheticum TaxID=238834 RepID=UPI001C0D6E4D|nr:hypothetical protein [Clostridium estertheticum]MBU3186541.1 hypothetical protein [Clostridium estertheticum]
MKKKMPFWFKVRFCIYWIMRHKETATVVTCGKCHGTRVTFQEGKQENNIYTSKYICEDCGSTAACVETWDIK